jgi:hypothetical protein
LSCKFCTKDIIYNTLKITGNMEKGGVVSMKLV